MLLFCTLSAHFACYSDRSICNGQLADSIVTWITYCSFANRRLSGAQRQTILQRVASTARKEIHAQASYCFDRGGGCSYCDGCHPLERRRSSRRIQIYRLWGLWGLLARP